MQTVYPALTWDIFCTVIDNYGDAGVCWRLAHNLAQRGQSVRLWIDQPDILAGLAPHGHERVQILPWHAPLPTTPGDVLVEAFGVHLDERVQAWRSPSSVWINLEYLSAENYVARCHLLQSPVMSGPAAGASKVFFYPGFTEATGGLLREVDLLAQHTAFQTQRDDFLRSFGVTQPERPTASLFCYEPPALKQWLTQWQTGNILVMQGRGASATRQALQDMPEHLVMLPWLTQSDFDRVLWASDFNAVRGEDSLVRALWAGQPLLWHIYQQDDNAHHDKLHAFLDWLQAPTDLRDMHYLWNGMSTGKLPAPTPHRLHEWRACIQAARARLLQQPDLVNQLLSYVIQQRGIVL